MPTSLKVKRRAAFTPTDIPGVFRNKAGVLVDEDGVAISFKTLRHKDNIRFQEAQEGSVLAQPADLLRAIALDPRMPLHVRIDAANKAAPYFTAKRMAVQGVPNEPPVSLNLGSMAQNELDALEKALALAQGILSKNTPQ